MNVVEDGPQALVEDQRGKEPGNEAGQGGLQQRHAEFSRDPGLERQ
jgi:hypothetical protein